MTEFRAPDQQQDRRILLLEAKRYIETDAIPSDADPADPADEKAVKSEQEALLENLSKLAKVLKEVDNA